MNLLDASKYTEAATALEHRYGAAAGKAATLGIRPEDMRIGSGDGIVIDVSIDVSENLGKEQLYHGRTDNGDEITISSRDKLNAAAGIRSVTVSPDVVHVFDADGQRLAVA